MIRSASTALFNVTRLFAEEARPGNTYTCWISDFDPARSATATISIIKTHAALDPPADIALTSHRDLRDVACSLRDIGFATGDDAIMSALQRAVEAHAYWAERAAYDMPYEEFVNDPVAIISAVANVLPFAVSSNASSVLKRLEQLSEPQSEPYDSLTLLHPRHLGAGGRPGRWRKVLGSALRERIEERWFEWLNACGYEVAGDD